MDTHYTFSATKFSPTAGELDEEHDDYINPGLFAKELADYIEKSLLKHGYRIKFRCQEDWGHWLEVDNDGKYTLAICCSNIDGDETDPTGHRVYVHPDKPVIRRWFRKIDIRADVEKLSSTIQAILSADPDISDLEVGEGR